MIRILALIAVGVLLSACGDIRSTREIYEEQRCNPPPADSATDATSWRRWFALAEVLAFRKTLGDGTAGGSIPRHALASNRVFQDTVNKMTDRNELQQIRNRTHQQQPSLERPEEELVAFTERLRHQLSPGALILDAGCGRARTTIYLCQLGIAAYGCDLSPVAVETTTTRVQKAHVSANFLVADLTCLPYLDNLFTAVVCVYVLPYHLKSDLAKGVQELRRVLQPNGWLYFDLLGCDDVEYRCGRELELDTFLDPDGMAVHFSTRQEDSELAEGLVLERVAHLESKSPVGKREARAVWATKPKG